MSDEKQWNVPSAIAFVGALLVGAGMLVAGAIYKDAGLSAQGAAALVLAGAIASPQPWVNDK